MKKTFCETCRKDVDVVIKDEEKCATLKGCEYHYQGKVAYCKTCGNPVHLMELNDQNLDTLYQIYRRENNLISLVDVLEIPKMYGIGKRPFSLLLGWGELTFTRYCDGDIPTKQYSDILQKIHDDPKYYLRILEENKDRLPSLSSYEKSKKKVFAYLQKQTQQNSKLLNMSAYLIEKCVDITPLALQKALYYTEGFYYAFYDSFLFEEDLKVYNYGPIYKESYDLYQTYVFDGNTPIPRIDESIFSNEEQSILNAVINNLCCYSGSVLKQMIEMDFPWMKTYRKKNHLKTSMPIINKKEMGDSFKRIKAKYNMESITDMQFYTTDLFQTIQSA